MSKFVGIFIILVALTPAILCGSPCSVVDNNLNKMREGIQTQLASSYYTNVQTNSNTALALQDAAMNVWQTNSGLSSDENSALYYFQSATEQDVACFTAYFSW